jgi:serine/threonine-protein kinase RsbW
MNLPADFGVRSSDLTEIVIPNDLRSAREPEERILAQLGVCGYDPDTVFAVKLALEEALTNAIKHGNRNDESKRIVVRFAVNPRRAVIMVRDEGNGFRPDAVPDPTADENLERPTGRGIMLMQAYMTRVRYNPAGNEVWMLKEKRTARSTARRHRSRRG